MISIAGKWYDGRTSRGVEGILRVYDNGAVCLEQAADGALLLRQAKLQAGVSDRLANTPRFLAFSEGGTFETEDNEGVDRILRQIQKGRWSLLVHSLESRKAYILAATLLVVALSVIGVKYGIPAGARLIAPLLPDSAYTLAESQTMRILDKMVFQPSELNDETLRRVESHLASSLQAHPELTLIFRKGGAVGPNAFALPAGTIVFTDELVGIAEHDDELSAIFAHEAGHVIERHAMRRVIQDSLLSFALMALTGDAAGVSELVMGLPVLLTEYAYSRGFERVADQHALNFLLQQNIPPHRFADILTRIEMLDQTRKRHSGARLASYISTHPPTAERIKPFLESVAR